MAVKLGNLAYSVGDKMFNTPVKNKNSNKSTAGSLVKKAGKTIAVGTRTASASKSASNTASKATTSSSKSSSGGGGSSSRSGGSSSRSTGTSTAKSTGASTGATGSAFSNMTMQTYKPEAIDTSAYDRMYAEYANKARSDADTQVTNTNAMSDDQLRQAYIQRMQNQVELDDSLANAGIRGGQTETSNLRLASNYENSRNAINAQRAQAIADIESNYNDNVFNYKQANDQAKQAYIEQRQAEQRAEKADFDAKQRAAQLDALTAMYGTWRSLSGLRRALAQARTPEHKAIIANRIAYLQDNNLGIK